MAEKTIFSAPAILSRISYLKDGGVSLGFSTNELTHEEKVTVSEFHGNFGHVLFKANEFTDEDIPKGDVTDQNKSPSQRLRAVLFIWWKELGEPGTWDFFYRQEMEKNIDAIKKRLE